MLPKWAGGFVKCYQNEQGELPTVTKMVSGVLFTNVIKSLIVFMLLYLELLTPLMISPFELTTIYQEHNVKCNTTTYDLVFNHLFVHCGHVVTSKY